MRDIHAIFLLRYTINILSSLQVVDAENEDELREAINSCDWRYDIDGLAGVVDMKNRDFFVQSAAAFFTKIRCKAMVDEFKKGLETYNVR